MTAAAASTTSLPALACTGPAALDKPTRHLLLLQGCRRGTGGTAQHRRGRHGVFTTAWTMLRGIKVRRRSAIQHFVVAAASTLQDSFGINRSLLRLRLQGWPLAVGPSAAAGCFAGSPQPPAASTDCKGPSDYPSLLDLLSPGSWITTAALVHQRSRTALATAFLLAALRTRSRQLQLLDPQE